MAPERVRGVSCRAGDLYALGATIYELATLRAAFEDTDQVRLIDRIAHEPPRPPRSIDRLVPRDLETIILKAMAKEPEGRFATAQEMAEELRKFVGGHPIRSRRITSAERLYRWCRRNPWLATANISAAALLITLAVGSTIAARSYRDDQARIAKVNEDLKKAEIKQRERFFDSLASEARARLYSRRVGQRFQSLDAIREAVQIGRSLGLPAEAFDRLRDEAIAAMMLPDIEQAGPSFHLDPEVVDFRTDNRLTRYAQLSRDGTIRVRRFSDNGLIAQIPGEGGEAYTSLRFSPGGRFLVARLSQLYRIWDLDTGGPAHVLSFPGDRGFFALSPNDRRIAVCLPGGNLEIRDLATGQVAFRSGGLGNLKDPVYRPDGTEIAVISQGNSPTCRIIDAETGRPLRSFPISGNPRLPRWSADGSTLAIPTGDNRSGSIDFHRAENGSRLDSIALPLQSVVQDLKMHPATPLLLSSGWDGVLRLWDWSSCRERLRFLESNIEFDCQGENEKFVVRSFQNYNEVSVWRVDPALELVSMSSTWNGPLNQSRTSIHPGGRLLSVGTETGVLLRDLARRSELAFLPIKNAQHTAFDPNGDLLTNGDAGFLRWPVRIDPATGALKVGPPRVISTQGTHFAIDTDRTGQIFGYSRRSTIHLNLGDRELNIPTGGDSRGFSICPDGRWMVTKYHGGTGPSRIFSLPDGKLVKKLSEPEFQEAVFSPDGRWLVSKLSKPTVIYEVGTWREVRRIDSYFEAFAPDGRLGLFKARGNILELIELETGRVLARLEPPDLEPMRLLTFSPDGSRIVAVTSNPSRTLIFDLRKIREGLARLDLDWDAPAFPEEDAARPDLPPLPAFQVDYGYLGPDAVLLQVLARPRDFDLKKFDPAIDALERALEGDPSNTWFKRLLADCCNNLAWKLATESPSSANLDRAMKLSCRAVELEPGEQVSLNTRGVVLYQARHFDEAVSTLEKSLAAGKGQFDGFDLYFLAMAHHRLGHREEARRCLDRAIAWVNAQASMPKEDIKELASFRTEAEAVLAGPVGELPDDVFERP